MRSYELRLSPCFLLLVGLQKKTTENFKIRTTGAPKLKSHQTQVPWAIKHENNELTPLCNTRKIMHPPFKHFHKPLTSALHVKIPLPMVPATFSRKNFICALSLSSKVIFGSVASIPSCCGWFIFPELKKLLLALHYMRHILGANINLRGDPTHELEQQLWGYSLIWVAVKSSYT